MARDIRIQMSHQGKLSGRLIQTRRTVIFTAAETLSILNRIVEDMLRVSSPLTCRIISSKMDKENIGDCREIQSELIRTHPPGGAAVGKQIKLLFFDAILHIAACTVDIFIQRLGIPFFSRNVRHNKAGIFLARQMFHLGNDIPISTPTAFGLPGKTGKNTFGFFTFTEKLFSLDHLRINLLQQSIISCHTSDIFDFQYLTLLQDTLTAEARVSTKNDTDIRKSGPDRANQLDQNLFGTLTGIHAGRSQPGDQGKIITEHIRAPLKNTHSVSDLIFTTATALPKCSRSPATLRFCRLVSVKNLCARFRKRVF